MIIWLIGFMFCWGMVDWSRERKGDSKYGFWDTMQKMISLVVLWPMFLGAIVCEIIEDKEKETKETE